MADEQADPGFAALPSTLQKRIDAAFDSALGQAVSDEEPARKRRKLEQPLQPGGFISEDPLPGGFIADEPAAGGFIVDDPSEGGFVRDSSPLQGGFLADDNESNAGRSTHIPLSSIPTALQLLDLPPDDEDVISVFRNAASGWGERTRAGSHPDEDPEGVFVSRKDWRAVCAALLDHAAADEEDVDMEHIPADGQVEDDKGPLEETPSDSEEEYVESRGGDSDAEDEEDSDDEYREGSGGFVRSRKAMVGTPATKSRRSRKARTTTESEEEDEGQRSLTARQKEECRAAFALFFPDVTDEDLDKQRIRIKDITRVAKLLKEKITAEETVEMLEAFSTAPDKSMSLADFERMMVAAKLA